MARRWRHDAEGSAIGSAALAGQARLPHHEQDHDPTAIRPKIILRPEEGTSSSGGIRCDSWRPLIVDVEADFDFLNGLLDRCRESRGAVAVNIGKINILGAEI